MKILKPWVITAAVLTTAFLGAADTRAAVTVQSATAATYLDYYDQLTAYIGKPGLFFVRQAAGDVNGQHGDPSVHRGWALYIWDTGNGLTKTAAQGWKKIAEEESLDSSASDLVLANYATNERVNEMVREFYNTAVQKEIYDEQMEGVMTQNQRNTASIGVIDENVNELQIAVARAEQKADDNAQAIQDISVKQLDIDIDLVDKPDCTFGDIYDAIAIICGKTNQVQAVNAP